MSVYFFNADYEESLLNNKNTISHSRFNQELEHLFWWISKDTLLSSRKYTMDYFDYIKRHTGYYPKLVAKTQENVDFFWGPLKNIEKEKKLNSKETSFKIAEKLGLNHLSSKLVFDESEMQLNSDYIYKTFFGLSGKGHIAGDDETRIKKELKLMPLIYEKKLDRLSDFSYLRLENSGVFYQTKVDKNFHYKGTIFSKKFHWPGLDISFENYLAKIESINQILLEDFFAKSPWSIDGYFYQEDNIVKTMVMCEINVRKTMGYIACLLSEQFCKDYPYSAFIMSKKSELSLDGLSLNLRLSPDDNKFHTYLIASEDSNLLVDFFNQA